MPWVAHLRMTVNVQESIAPLPQSSAMHFDRSTVSLGLYMEK